MSVILGMILSTFMGICAWLYQKAWDRAEARRLRYEDILINLPAFLEGSKNPDLIKKVLDEQRRLWLTAPKSVINAFSDFTDSIRDGNKLTQKQRLACLRSLIFAMRNDTNIWSIIRPRLQSEEISLEKLKMDRPSDNTTPQNKDTVYCTTISNCNKLINNLSLGKNYEINF